jgi:hypothetical protein
MLLSSSYLPSSYQSSLFKGIIAIVQDKLFCHLEHDTQCLVCDFPFSSFQCHILSVGRELAYKGTQRAEA